MDKERNNREVQKVGAAENISKIESDMSLDEKVCRAKAFAAKANAEGAKRTRTFTGPSNDEIIRALIEIGYTKEEAEASIAASL